MMTCSLSVIWLVFLQNEILVMYCAVILIMENSGYKYVKQNSTSHYF